MPVDNRMLSRVGLTEAAGVTGALRMSSTSFGGFLYPCCARLTSATSSSRRIDRDGRSALLAFMMGSSAETDDDFVDCHKGILQRSELIRLASACQPSASLPASFFLCAFLLCVSSLLLCAFA